MSIEENNLRTRALELAGQHERHPASPADIVKRAAAYLSFITEKPIPIWTDSKQAALLNAIGNLLISKG